MPLIEKLLSVWYYANHCIYVISWNPHNRLVSNISPLYRWGNCISESFNRMVQPPHNLSGLKARTTNHDFTLKRNTIKKERREQKGPNIRDISTKVVGTALQSQEPKYKSLLPFLFYPRRKRGKATCGGWSRDFPRLYCHWLVTC